MLSEAPSAPFSPQMSDNSNSSREGSESPALPRTKNDLSPTASRPREKSTVVVGGGGGGMPPIPPYHPKYVKPRSMSLLPAINQFPRESVVGIVGVPSDPVTVHLDASPKAGAILELSSQPRFDLREKVAKFREQVLIIRSEYELDETLQRVLASSRSTPPLPPSQRSTDASRSTSPPPPVAHPLPSVALLDEDLPPPSTGVCSNQTASSGSSDSHLCTEPKEQKPHNKNHPLDPPLPAPTMRTLSPPLDSTAGSLDILAAARRVSNDNSMRAEMLLGGTNRSDATWSSSPRHNIHNNTKRFKTVEECTAAIARSMKGFLDAFDALFEFPVQQPLGRDSATAATSMQPTAALGSGEPDCPTEASDPRQEHSSEDRESEIPLLAAVRDSPPASDDMRHHWDIDHNSDPASVVSNQHNMVAAVGDDDGAASQPSSTEETASIDKRIKRKLPQNPNPQLVRGSSFVSSASYGKLPPSVTVTRVLRITRDPEGRKIINNSYSIMRLIGRGAQGKVKLAVHLRTKLLVAIKIFTRRVRKHPNLPFKDPEVEAQIMARLTHEAIIPIIEVINAAGAEKLYIVMHFVKNGCLFHVHPNGTISCDPFPWSRARVILRQLIAGVQHLHRHGIIHRDIKPENILVTENDRIFITDFGVAEMFEDDEEPIVYGTIGTPSFFAPELLEYNENGSGTSPLSPACGSEGSNSDDSGPPLDYKKKGVDGHPVDVWAIGVTAYCMLFGKLPYHNSNMRILRELQKTPPSFPPDTDPLLVDFMLRMLHPDPKLRLTLHAARSHPWIKGNETLIDSPPTVCEATATALSSQKSRTSFVSTAGLGSTVAYQSSQSPPSLHTPASPQQSAALDSSPERDEVKGTTTNNEQAMEDSNDHVEEAEDGTEALYNAMRAVMLSPAVQIRPALELSATPPRLPRGTGRPSVHTPSKVMPPPVAGDVQRSHWRRILIVVLAVVRLLRRRIRRQRRGHVGQSPSFTFLETVVPRPPVGGFLVVNPSPCCLAPQPPASPSVTSSSVSSARGRSPSRSSLSSLPPAVDTTQGPRNTTEQSQRSSLEWSPIQRPNHRGRRGSVAASVVLVSSPPPHEPQVDAPPPLRFGSSTELPDSVSCKETKDTRSLLG